MNVATFATADEVLAACDRALAASAPAEALPLAAFDADHTLWNADAGDLAWHAALGARSFRAPAREALAGELALAGARSSGDVHEDARALYALYKQDRVSEISIVRAMTACYAGWTVDELRALGQRIAREHLDPARYEGMAEVVAGLRERGLRVVVVSGSPTWLVAEGVRGRLPVDADEDVLGAEVEVAGDGSGTSVLASTMREPITFFEGKVAALAARFPGRASFAFGDSGGDVPLLESAARLAFAVHPRPALRKLAGERARFRIFAPARTVSGTPVRAPGTDRVIE